MAITNTPVLTEENKTFIRNNSEKFTARELADHFNVKPQLIHSYCNSNKLTLKKGCGAYNPIGKSSYFNVDTYFRTVTTI